MLVITFKAPPFTSTVNTHVYQYVDTKCFNALTGIQVTVKILNLLGRDIFSSTKRPSDKVLDTDLEIYSGSGSTALWKRLAYQD
jgi:hypothetical protein